MELYEFLKLGEHPYYYLGMKESKIIKIKNLLRLDRIIDESVTLYHDSLGNELTVLDGKLFTFKLRLNWKYQFFIKGKKLPALAKLNSIISLLKKNNIHWNFKQRYCFSDQLCIETEGGILMSFLFNGEKIHLTGINMPADLY